MTIPEFQTAFRAAVSEEEKLKVCLKALSSEGYCMGMWSEVSKYKEPVDPTQPIQVLG